jgi:hypothetical protein
LEQLLAARRLARHVVLLPLNGDLERVEDLLDAVGDLLADTVAGDERDGVLAAKLRRQLGSPSVSELSSGSNESSGCWAWCGSIGRGVLTRLSSARDAMVRTIGTRCDRSAPLLLSPRGTVEETGLLSGAARNPTTHRGSRGHGPQHRSGGVTDGGGHHPKRCERDGGDGDDYTT